MHAALCLALVVLLAGALPAQSPGDRSGPTPPTANRSEWGSISGIVRDADSGEPLAGISVVLDTAGAGAVHQRAILQPDSGGDYSGFTVTDSAGRFAFPQAPPGTRLISAHTPGDTSFRNSRKIELPPRGKVDGVALQIDRFRSVSGTVTDENGVPIAGAEVSLVNRVYYLGRLHAYVERQTSTDPEGYYEFGGLERTDYRLLAVTRGDQKRQAAVMSNVPIDQKRRRPAYALTYYPNSDTPEGATAFRLLSGENREGMDIRVRRTASYCVSGHVPADESGPRPSVMVEPVEPSHGMNHRSRNMMIAPGPTVGLDGQFRICGLAPGGYRFTAMSPGGLGKPPVLFAETDFILYDRDIDELPFAFANPVELSGRVVWAATPPSKPLRNPVHVSLEPIYRPPRFGEQRSASVAPSEGFRFQ